MDSVIKIGETAPDFALPDLQGQIHSLADYRGRVVVINFWSAECPWAARADDGLRAALQPFGGEVMHISVASNANETREQIAQAAGQRRLPLLLLDREQAAARSFRAATTPHIFVVDAQGRLRYRGAYDDVTFRRREPTRAYALEAVQALLAGGTPDPAETRPYGCAVVLEV